MSFTAIFADRHKAFMKGLTMCVHKDYPDANILYQIDNFAELLPILENNQPDILVIDYCLKDGYLLHHIQSIRENYPAMKIMVCTMKFNLSTMLPYVGLIDGFIGKHAHLHEVNLAFHEVLKGNTFFAIASEI